MKLLVKIVLVLILLVVIGAIIGVMYIDSYAKGAVEESATKSFGVTTTLDSGDVKIFSSEFTMGGVHVDNPEGYDADHFLTINDGGVSVTLASLMEDVVELPTLTFTGVDVNLQRNAGGGNYGIILENLKGGDETADTEGKKKFIIRTVKIQDIDVHADLMPIGGQLTEIETLHIEEITLTDVGSGGDGVKLSEVANIVMQAIFAAIVSKGGSLPADIQAELGSKLAALGDLKEQGISMAVDALGGVGDRLGETLKDTGGVGDALGEDVGEAVEEGVGGILEGAGGLLGGKKDEPEEDNPE